MHSRYLKLPLILGATLVFTACTREESPRYQAADSTAAARPAEPNVVTVTATDYAYDAPAEIPAGLTTFRLVGQGKEMHHLQLVRLEEGKTAADYMQALKAGGPLPSWAVDAGGPNASRPGAEATATQMLTPGNYVMLCFVPSPDGAPHLTKGMVRPLKVVPAAGPSAAEPTTDVVMTLADYDFRLSRPLAAGKQTIRVDNTAAQAHEALLVRLAPGKTAQDVVAWVDKQNGPPPGEPLGGVTGMAQGTRAYFTADLTPGDYALICFLPDAKDGKPHFVHGMMKQIRIS